jgi:hypothetical protein
LQPGAKKSNPGLSVQQRRLLPFSRHKILSLGGKK